MRMVSRRIVKARERFRQRKSQRKQMIQTLNKLQNDDNGIFAEVDIRGKTMRGLLDTGASVSLLGKNCRELITELNLENFYIIGKVTLSVQYKNVQKEILFYLCPYLQQELYLGIDFWYSFELAPDVVNPSVPSSKANDVSLAELSIDSATEYFGPPKVPGDVHKLHNLTVDQQQTLDAVMKKFPSFEVRGLDRTGVEKHTIQSFDGSVPIKERHFPISPAVQEIVFAEIDKMVKLGVIQESERPWSNRFTVVRKPGKKLLLSGCKEVECTQSQRCVSTTKH